MLAWDAFPSGAGGLTPSLACTGGVEVLAGPRREPPSYCATCVPVGAASAGRASAGRSARLGTIVASVDGCAATLSGMTYKYDRALSWSLYTISPSPPPT